MPFGERLARWFDDFVGARGPAARGEPTAWLELPRILVKTTWQYLFLERRLSAFEVAVDHYAARTAPQRLSGKTARELRDDLRAFLEIRLRGWTGAALSDAAAMACYGGLNGLLARALPERGTRLLHGMLQGLDGLVSAEPVHALWELAREARRDVRLRALLAERPAGEALRALADFPRFRARFEDYLERWGFRFSGELMLTVPSFQERPEELLAILARYAADDALSPAARLAEQKRERLAVTREVLAALGPWRAALARPLIAATQATIGYRERARLKQALLYSRLRRVALEIGARLVSEERLRSPEHVFYLTASELDELLSGLSMFPRALAALVELRRGEHEAFTAIQPADVLRAAEGEYPSGERAAEEATSASLLGASACGGQVTGRARVLTDARQACELRAGDVLVTRQTDPGWAPVFVAIRGLVLERGGMLSHGAILAREYGIPTVVGVAGASSRIPDGATVYVDGDRGVVRVLR
jgi:pyruvate,water dikinase